MNIMKMNKILIILMFFIIGCSPYWYQKQKNPYFQPSERVVVYDTNENFDETWKEMLESCNGGMPRVVHTTVVMFGVSKKMWIYYSCER